MCLAIPARIEELTTPGNAIVNLFVNILQIDAKTIALEDIESIA